jgi:hypothetical protein
MSFGQPAFGRLHAASTNVDNSPLNRLRAPSWHDTLKRVLRLRRRYGKRSRAEEIARSGTPKWLDRVQTGQARLRSLSRHVKRSRPQPAISHWARRAHRGSASGKIWWSHCAEVIVSIPSMSEAGRNMMTGPQSNAEGDAWIEAVGYTCSARQQGHPHRVDPVPDERSSCPRKASCESRRGLNIARWAASVVTRQRHRCRKTAAISVHHTSPSMSVQRRHAGAGNAPAPFQSC